MHHDDTVVEVYHAVLELSLTEARLGAHLIVGHAIGIGNGGFNGI